MSNYQITPSAGLALMAIGRSRVAIDHLPIHPGLLASLPESARLLSTHYSTQIEGNRLTLPEVKEVIAGHGGLPGRKRDEKEVLNYYQAAEKAESLAALTRPLIGLRRSGSGSSLEWNPGIAQGTSEVQRFGLP